MADVARAVVGFVAQVQNGAIAVVLAGLLALGLRLFVLAFSAHRAVFATVRCLGGLAFLAVGLSYALFTANLVTWNANAMLLAAFTAAVVLASLGWRRLVGRPADAAVRPGVVGTLVQAVLLLSLLLVAALTLMRAGFLSLTTDQPVLLVELTGQTRPQLVQWAAPGQPPRREVMTEHRVVFRSAEGALISETWVYGDAVAVKGRVLRLHALLNAAGVTNLFELLFAHNGYSSADRHASMPHTATKLPAMGPLAVHPWWRPLQQRLLDYFETRVGSDSHWAVKSATTESTYFALVDETGNPVRRTYRLVLTPGGLSSS